MRTIIIALLLIFIFSCREKKPVEHIYAVALRDMTIKQTSDYRVKDNCGILRSNEIREIYDVYGDYIKVEAIGTNGWMWNDILKKKTCDLYEATANAALLDKPGRPSKLLGGVEKGIVVRKIGIAPTWYKITNGWIYAGYVRTFTNAQ